jgi:hypothetical protein
LRQYFCRLLNNRIAVFGKVSSPAYFLTVITRHVKFDAKIDHKPAYSLLPSSAKSERIDGDACTSAVGVCLHGVNRDSDVFTFAHSLPASICE